MKPSETTRWNVNRNTKSKLVETCNFQQCICRMVFSCGFIGGIKKVMLKIWLYIATAWLLAMHSLLRLNLHSKLWILNDFNRLEPFLYRLKFWFHCPVYSSFSVFYSSHTQKVWCYSSRNTCESNLKKIISFDGCFFCLFVSYTEKKTQFTISK